MEAYGKFDWCCSAQKISKFLRNFRLDSRISGAHKMWQDNINFGESFGLRGRNRTVAGEVGGTPGSTLPTHYTDTNGES